MTIQDFVLEAMKAVKAHFAENGKADVEIRETEVVKANDVRVHGLLLIPEGDFAGRSVYIDDLFGRHEEGEERAVLMDELTARCESALKVCGPPVGAAVDLAFEKIQKRLTVRLLGVRNNISYMADRPYIDVGSGLALIAVINCEPSAMSEWVISVTNELLREHIGCDKETLLTAALKNTMAIEPPHLSRLEEHMIASLTGRRCSPDYLTEPISPENVNEAFMLTNSSGFQGAAALFYPGVMERLAEVFGCGYYVLPSSIHEMIILPDVTDPDVEGLSATVIEANRTVVSGDEILAWNVFHYDPEEGRLMVA